MVRCLMCWDELRSTTTDTLCPSCRPLYKVSRPTSRRVIPPDCVSKDDLRKLVEEVEKTGIEYDDCIVYKEWNMGMLLGRIKDLLKRGVSDGYE